MYHLLGTLLKSWYFCRMYDVESAMSAITAVVPNGVGAVSIAELPMAGGIGYDLVATVGNDAFAVRILPRGSLSTVRAAVESHGSPLPLLLVSPVMTVGAREYASERRVSWVDGTGAARIVAPGVLVALEGRGQIVEPRSWSPSALSVAEAVLSGATPTVRGIIEVTGLSQGSSARGLNFLGRRGLLTAEVPLGRSAHRSVPDRERMLEEFADAVTLPSPYLNVGVIWRDPIANVEQFGTLLTDAGISWAVTGALTAAVAAPVATQIAPLVVYLGVRDMAGLLAASRRANVEPMDSGRLQLRPFPSKANQLLTRRIERTAVSSVSFARAYADLRDVGVRGEGAAGGLKDIVLR